MRPWFTTEQLAPDTWVISEYRHWEETHCYLLIGADRALLIDTGLGICNIYDEVCKLTDKPVTAVATHIHWDHIGGHGEFDRLAVHELERNWLDGHFPLPPQAVRQNLTARPCPFPDGFDPAGYQVFQGPPQLVFQDGHRFDLGGRVVEAVHTPGHSPGHCCFYEPERRRLYAGDLIYKGCLDMFYPPRTLCSFWPRSERSAAWVCGRCCPATISWTSPPPLSHRWRRGCAGWSDPVSSGRGPAFSTSAPSSSTCDPRP